VDGDKTRPIICMGSRRYARSVLPEHRQHDDEDEGKDHDRIPFRMTGDRQAFGREEEPAEYRHDDGNRHQSAEEVGEEREHGSARTENGP